MLDKGPGAKLRRIEKIEEADRAAEELKRTQNARENKVFATRVLDEKGARVSDVDGKRGEPFYPPLDQDDITAEPGYKPGEHRPDEPKTIKSLEKQLQAIQESLDELKKQNEQLRQENELLRQMARRAQEIVFIQSSIEINAFVTRWVDILCSTDYYIGSLLQPSFGLQTVDRTRVIWWLPDIITNRLRAVYGPQFGSQQMEALMIREIQGAIFNRMGLVSSGYLMQGQMGYPPVPAIGQVVAGGNVNINQMYGGYPMPWMVAPGVTAPGGVVDQPRVPAPSSDVPVDKDKKDKGVEKKPDVVVGDDKEKKDEKPLTSVPVVEVPEKKEKEGKLEDLLPKDGAVNRVLLDLLSKYNLEKGYGKWRQGILPIVAGFGASVETGKIFSDIGGPLAGGLGGAAFSLAGSLVRRCIGKESTFSLFARYSHIEGGKGFKGFLKKAGQLFGRGLERTAIKEALMLDGTKEVCEMASWTTWGKIPDAKVTELKEAYQEEMEFKAKKLSLEKAGEWAKRTYGRIAKGERTLKDYVVQGLWYLTAHAAAIDAGAYLTDEEKRQWEATGPRVAAALSDLLKQTGYDFSKPEEKDKAIALMQDAEEEIGKMENKKYQLSTLSMGGAAALKGIATFFGIKLIANGVHKLIDKLSNPPAPIPVGGPVGPGAGPENIPVLQGEMVRTDQTLGHLFERHGMDPDYLWEANTGLPIMREFGRLNASNQDMWKQLWWVATKPHSWIGPDNASQLRDLLIKVGVDGAKGDFLADASAFAPGGALNTTNYLDLCRYAIDSPGASIAVLNNNPLQVALPSSDWFNQVVTAAP